jgi:hypothetical protein
VLSYIKVELEYVNPVIVAHYLRSKLSNSEFLSSIHWSLYNQFKSSPSPGAITNAVAGLAQGLRAIITFNFDDLIEQALAAQKQKFKSVWLEKHLVQGNDVSVFHPHGYLPYNMTSNEPYWVVLSESDYHSQYASVNNWTNRSLTDALLTATCLFVSTSITDPNMRRILDNAKRLQPDGKHFFLWSREEPDPSQTSEEVIVQDAYIDIFEDSNARLGLYPVWFYARKSGNRWADVPDILNEIRR